MGDFTLRLLKNIEKMILRKCVLSMLRAAQREKTNSQIVKHPLKQYNSGNNYRKLYRNKKNKYLIHFYIPT